MEAVNESFTILDKLKNSKEICFHLIAMEKFKIRIKKEREREKGRREGERRKRRKCSTHTQWSFIQP
jgi:hypothetical protein